MFEQLRTKDDELFRELARVCRHLAHSTRLLEQMLAGRRDDEARLAHAIHETDREAHDLAQRVDVRAFKAFVLRVDRMDLHALANTLESAVDAVDKAGAHAAALHASGAPDDLRSLAALLTRAAEELEAAVPHVTDAPEQVEARTAEVRRIADRGEAAFDRGVAEQFSATRGAPDAVEVLRWKDVYVKVWHALDRCADAADALQQLAHQSIR